MRFPFPRLLLVLLLPVVAIAQMSPPPRAATDAGFGPWLDPNHTAPAGMQYRTFVSKLAGTEVSYVVYLPPDYDAATERRYPVVYWLHGRGGSQTGAVTFASRLDRLGHHQLFTQVVPAAPSFSVMPRADSSARMASAPAKSLAALAAARAAMRSSIQPPSPPALPCR